MTTKFRCFLLFLILLLAVQPILCQTGKQSFSDPGYVKTYASGLLNQLLDNQWEASERIVWEDFSLNGKSLGDEYVGAFENYEEDLFIQDTFKKIHGMLHYKGDKGDKFTNWNVKIGDTSTKVTSENRKKDVEMRFHNSNTAKAFLYSLKVTDK
jgi:hypothetical protein